MKIFPHLSQTATHTHTWARTHLFVFVLPVWLHRSDWVCSQDKYGRKWHPVACFFASFIPHLTLAYFLLPSVHFSLWMHATRIWFSWFYVIYNCLMGEKKGYLWRSRFWLGHCNCWQLYTVSSIYWHMAADCFLTVKKSEPVRWCVASFCPGRSSWREPHRVPAI